MKPYDPGNAYKKTHMCAVTLMLKNIKRTLLAL